MENSQTNFAGRNSDEHHVGDEENIYFGTTSGIAQIKKDYFENGENE